MLPENMRSVGYRQIALSLRRRMSYAEYVPVTRRIGFPIS